jgi:putative methyltransferase (TIGR04325 family)
VSGSERPFPRHPLKALRARLQLITSVADETRQQVLESREVLLARLDSLTAGIEQIAGAEVGDGAAEESSVLRRPHRVVEWEYMPDGWAAERTQEAGGGWEVDSVARMYADRWPMFLETLQGTGPVGALHVVPTGHTIPREDLISHNMAMVFAYVLALSARATNSLSILDWGGALGHYHALARVLVPELALDYHCKELPAVCRQGRRVSPEVTFHESEACLERSYDLVLASGAIQYAEDWVDLLARLAGAADRCLLVTKVPVTDAPSFVTLQRAYEYGYNTEYLGWALNRSELETAARHAGVELVREFFLSATLDIPDAPGTIHHAGFLFAVR